MFAFQVSVQGNCLLELGISIFVIQGVFILCAQKLTTYKIIGEHCGVILFLQN